ncbi:MAG: phosphoribosylformimino-5-aminoimidazole carboxamide ribotide isomerase [Epulopiscium sp.]|jgi:phosphoribosylformimino-5-aminoimidazole carboxamide ribotide isomerase|uniref:1-(5-phosphoribosyl)-5-[(5-phosphoribosylamino)methylideneamino] imidazole-4-carboxamide isomerase n=1 Tax=Defluviitalea raffinosedens TaxID=1450156 RepID=A0A7C8HG29_9FIRM|nr:1-(5-phosphoribosyl)-5-[(5-phosphoribosylamino)methylideneamino]imidazole-4-carboxamide isomerase [Defluviitalea raffinosedens]MBZ4668180.1 hisA [Defluviitaleaceae bacterium]MDK2789481.1 phosphoribosylformimino-5-aminoimidazole carboxamide ribotide isomerase [Candidatus Epulonipiscium sp.]KAE9636938.1 1-(5-phosphoribosyl)-5-[(5-phosphoribosylamino)methylideneamino]imidazole-4-carboxamide isomerase [Defluviitalea raffinosedens]MBM7685311.1 phosphoribosylformimino-5-aminoimidazole carboxamide 
MRIYPAIDIKGGKCVRLSQGRFDHVTVYSDNPVDMAKEWVKKGASFIHIVDLDGALSGEEANKNVIKEIVKNMNVPVQTGGGIRSIDSIKDRLSLGVNRVIIGTAAVKNPDLVREAIKLFGSERIVVGIDAKDGRVAVEGWEELSDVSAVDLCLQMKKIGVKTIIYTDISKDGMLCGVNIEATKDLIDKTDMDIIASGGVAALSDLEKVSQIGAEGVIIGKALYQGTIDLAQAIQRFESR